MLITKVSAHDLNSEISAEGGEMLALLYSISHVKEKPKTTAV